jgi:hypothetical protein
VTKIIIDEFTDLDITPQQRQRLRYPERCKAADIKHREKVKADPVLLEKDRERNRNSMQLYLEENRDEVNMKRRERYKKDKRMDMLRTAKYRAIANNIPHTLVKEDIIIPEFCPILGLELKSAEGRAIDCSPSLDRIIPSLGYVKDNIQVISQLANQMKSSASPEQLLAFGNWCVSMYGKDAK